MASVRIEIVRFTDEWQPGFVECRLTDIFGHSWVFEEKIPIVTSEYLDASSEYPCLGTIGCTVLSRSADSVRVAVDPLSDSFECEVPSWSILEDLG